MKHIVYACGNFSDGSAHDCCRVNDKLKKRIEELEILRKSIDADFPLEPHEEKTLDYLQEFQKIIDGKNA